MPRPLRSNASPTLKLVAKNAAREIANVPPRHYEITYTEFLGQVEKVELPYDRIAYGVPMTWESMHENDEVLTTTEGCRWYELQDRIEMRR